MMMMMSELHFDFSKGGFWFFGFGMSSPLPPPGTNCTTGTVLVTCVLDTCWSHRSPREKREVIPRHFVIYKELESHVLRWTELQGRCM
jgi:hypothetical protein